MPKLLFLCTHSHWCISLERLWEDFLKLSPRTWLWPEYIGNLNINKTCSETVNRLWMIWLAAMDVFQFFIISDLQSSNNIFTIWNSSSTYLQPTIENLISLYQTYRFFLILWRDIIHLLMLMFEKVRRARSYNFR